jgi:outer membrane protein assembly factor BamB
VSTTTEPQRPGAPRRRIPVRVWFPVVTAVTLGGVFAAVWTWPSEDFSRFYRAVATMPIVSLAVLLALIWWVFMSGVRWPVREAVPLLVVAAAVAAVRKVDFSGDMMPLVLFRWESNPADVLEAYERSHPAAVEVASVAETSAKDDPSDYPEYRNRARDGVAFGPPLARDWRAKPPRLLWKHPCGGGYAGMAVAGGLAVTIEQRREDEAVVCYDAATGQERWAYSYPAHFFDFRAEGPMATPTLVGGDVYSLGGTGKLVCLSLATGKLKWEVDALADNGNLTWGMSGSPLVYEDVVVVSPGEQRNGTGRAVVAYDRQTGKKVWGAGNGKGAYASPMLATRCGVRQIVVFEGKRLAGYDASGRGELWSTPWESQNGINVAQPLVLGDDRLFVTSRYANRCGVVRLVKQGGETNAGAAIGICCGPGAPGFIASPGSELRPVEEWHNAALRCPFSSPVLYDGLVYGLNEGTLTCVDPVDGRRVWKGENYYQGQLLRCGDLLVVLSEFGELALVQAAAEKSRELGRVRVLEGKKNWNCPTLAGGKAYVRNHLEMACYDLRE